MLLRGCSNVLSCIASYFVDEVVGTMTAHALALDEILLSCGQGKLMDENFVLEVVDTVNGPVLGRKDGKEAIVQLVKGDHLNSGLFVISRVVPQGLAVGVNELSLNRGLLRLAWCYRGEDFD